MRKALLLLFALIVALVSCEPKISQDDHSGNYQFNGLSFRNVNLTGANALALAAPGSTKTKAATKADTSDVLLLYKVDDSGNLEEVEYTISVDGDEGMQEIVTAKLKLAIEYIYSIGTKWLWLYHCTYYCEDIDQIENDEVRNVLNGIIFEFNDPKYYHSFLVRRSDGALFAWDDDSNPSVSGFPWNNGEKIRMSDAEVQQCVKCIEEDIVTAPIVENGYCMLYYISDEGDILNVKKLLNDGVYSYNLIVPIPGQHAFVFIPTHVNEHVVMFTESAKMKLIDKSALASNESSDPFFNGFLTDGEQVYLYCNNTLYPESGEDPYKGVAWLTLGDSGEKIYLYPNEMGRFCSLGLEQDETVFLYTNTGGTTRKYHITSTADDPMCFQLKSTNNDERGIPLEAGSYDVYLRGNRIYLDYSANRTHDFGPIVYLHPVNVSESAQTASIGNLYMKYFGQAPAGQHSPLSWYSLTSIRETTKEEYDMNFVLMYRAALDVGMKSFDSHTIILPEGFPGVEANYIDGCAYMLSGTDGFYVYSLETLEREYVPIVLSELSVDVVGSIDWNFDPEQMFFWGRARTLEGAYVYIYVPVIGDKRGIARITVVDVQGAGENIAQLIKLN